MLGLHAGSVVSADMLLELLWGDDPPRTAAKALQTHISSLRRALGDGFVVTEGTGWILNPPETDASRYKRVTRIGRDAASSGDTAQAVARFEEALSLWRGTPELPDNRRGISEKTRWIESHAALVEDRADALLATGRAAEIIGELEAAVADAPLRERRWGQLMLALYRAGRQGEALAAFRRARSLLSDELGVDPGTELRRLEAAIVAQDAALDTPVLQQASAVTRAVTFLLTDIEGSTAAWEADSNAMAVALARHDELVEQVVTSRGGRLIKTRGEGDATFSVFDRPSGAAAAALELQDAILHEPWALRAPLRVRVALHTGEAELRDGDYFGRAVNRAARLRSLAEGAQILCSGATAELVIDSLPDDVVLADLGMRNLKNLARPEHVFELRLDVTDAAPQPGTNDDAFERPTLPAVLTGPGPFVGRVQELERLLSAWQSALSGGTRAVLIAGEPGVGKTRLGGEWSQQAYQQGAVVLYGRCDEDLGAPYQPFAEALRSLMPCVGARRLRALRGIEALLSLVPALTDVLPDLAAPTRADPDTERYALFDAVVALLEAASTSAPVVLILDDLHWAAKPTLLLLRHLLRFGDHARVQVVGTYRSTDLDRSHPLAAMLADLHRDGTAERINLGGLDGRDVTAYVAESGYDDEDLANALASVTGGNPFFLIEALRHVEESGGTWDQSTLPQGVREAVSRRLSRLPAETNKALAAAAVVGSRFAVELVEQVVEDDLVDAFDEACKAGIIIEEPGGRYRFNHAIVRQSLLAELASVRRMRLHQRIAATLEAQAGAKDELLAELAHHYFECAWAGNAAKAVEYCRRAADQAMARLAYEGAADLYDRALHAMEELDDELPDRDDQTAELLVARCEALLAAGDVTSAPGAVAQLRTATVDSARLAAWATCFDGQLSMLIHPERLDEVEAALGAAAEELAGLDDAAGEATAHTVRAGCLARLGRIGDCEIALDEALTAARRAREHRRVNAVLAGAPLAALWGPNPVPRAGGRCLDVVRLLRITTDSPAVEATSTRCQAVLEAFRGRAAAARRMIDSARRTVTELGLRHALMEVEQFAGIVELIADDPGAAEPHLRKAYNGFRRMGLDADTAETAALLGRACLALDQIAEADELCLESERLAGNALKPSIAWRVLRAHLLSRNENHDEARLVAEAAVALAERTDALVDHGDACLSLAMVLGAAGEVVRARAVAEQAADLYERKGAVALAERARGVIGEQVEPVAPTSHQPPAVEFRTAAAQASDRVVAAIAREAWSEFDRLFAPDISIESRRKVIGFKRADVPSNEIMRQTWGDLRAGTIRISHVVIAVRGEHLALARVSVGTADASPGSPHDELLQVYGVDNEGRFNLQVWFDLEDIDAAMAELDAVHAKFEHERLQSRRLENAAALDFERVWSHYAARDWDAMGHSVADNYLGIDHRRVVSADNQHTRDEVIRDLQAAADVGFTISMVSAIAIRGDRLVLAHLRAVGSDPDAIQGDALSVVEVDADDRIATVHTFDPDDFDSAIAELDARYLAGEAASHALVWSMIAESCAVFSREEFPEVSSDAVFVDHRRAAAFGSTDLTTYIRAGYDLGQHIRPYLAAVHRLTDLGAVCSYAAHGISDQGFDAEWQGVNVTTVDGDIINRCEFFDEGDLATAIARFDELCRPTPRLENAASQMCARMWTYFASRDWDAMSEVVAADEIVDDRRRVVNAGVRQGRDSGIEELRTAAEVGFTITMKSVVATRGDRLALVRVRASGRDPESIQNDAYNVVELDAAGLIAEVVVFDLDDFDVAIAELDRRYLAAEAAPFADTWPVVAGTYTSVSRHESPALTSDFVGIDHRRVAAFADGDLIRYFRARLKQGVVTYVEAVHQLNGLGALLTHAAYGTSHEGFDAEWHEVAAMTVQGDMVNRCELFDETDIDAALARFEQLSHLAPRLENAASQTVERFWKYFADRDWTALAETMADDVCTHDRRPVVSADVLRGRAAHITNMRAVAEVGFDGISSTVIATRGQHLTLVRIRSSVRGSAPDEVTAEMLSIVGVDPDNRIASAVIFDPTDIDAAFSELEVRYMAGEAAAYAHTWSVVSNLLVAHNRREIAPSTPDMVSIDHRRVAAFAPGEFIDYLRAGWELGQNLHLYIETAHRVNNLGAVFTWAGHGSSHEGFDAEWRGITLMGIDGDMVSRMEVFDDTALDIALERFDEVCRRAPRRLENAASQVWERIYASFAARDWKALSEIAADDFRIDDRRRVVNAGIRYGRDAAITDVRVMADVGFALAMVDVTATRGSRLALVRVRASGQDPEVVQNDAYNVAEIDSGGRISAAVVFDLEDFDAAIAELDARYLAGEAAPYSTVWSVVTAGYAALNRHELPLLTPDALNVDHRRARNFAPGDLPEYLDASWQLMPNASMYIAAVHRLTSVGAVVTQVVHGTTPDGFDAEWRELTVLKAVGDRMSGCELFDEEDFDAALARFEQLCPRSPQLESAVAERFLTHLAARDWNAMAQDFADNYYFDDRRQVVNVGFYRGRDAAVEDLRVGVDIGLMTNVTPLDIIATRGERCILTHWRASGPDREAAQLDGLLVLDFDTDEQIAACVVFDLNDIDAAFTELDARYLAGEAAPYAQTWSVIAGSYAALNRHEFPATTTDWVVVDHRGESAFGPDDLEAYVRAGRTVPQFEIHVEAVHRLNSDGAVVIYAAHEISKEGFDAEWRGVAVLTIDGDVVSRCEIFDDAEIDTAIARFDRLPPLRRRVENTASRTYARMWQHFMAGDWASAAETIAHDIVDEDGRRVVGHGIRRGRDAEVENLRATAELGITNVTPTVVATRGERLALHRVWFSGVDQQPGAFFNPVLRVIGTDADERVAVAVLFDIDDFDAALAELDARYAAGEAAGHARTWSLITDTHAAVNRRELPAMTRDSVYIDHRPLVSIEGVDLAASLRAAFDLTSTFTVYIEAVNRLDELGGVVTQVVHATMQEGLDTELRIIEMFIVEGDLYSRVEVFDEADLDAALARFDELHPQTPRLENTASQVYERFRRSFAARDWGAMSKLLSADTYVDDHRRVVNAATRRGREFEIANMQAFAEIGAERSAATVVATRGERVVLCRTCISGEDQQPGAFHIEFFNVVEITADQQIAARCAFDFDDFETAIAELDARYITGEAANCADTWSVIAEFQAAFNRRELPSMTTDPGYIDHRPLVSVEEADLAASIRALFDIFSAYSVYVEAVHRLDELGAVYTQVHKGTSHDGVDVELRMIQVQTVEGDLMSRVEVFDEADLDAALARFDELHPQTPRLANTASQVYERFRRAFAARDWDAVTQTLGDDIVNDDRRRVVSAGVLHGRDATLASMRASAALGLTTSTTTVTAARGERLVLGRERFYIGNERSEAFATEVAGLNEIDADGRIVTRVVFDLEDFYTAIDELDARYLAGEAAAHAHTWSVMMQVCAALNSGELPATTADFFDIDHRSVAAIGPGDLLAYIRAALDDGDYTIYVEAVHRLSDLGAVVTLVSRGTSHEGLDGEWRMTDIFTVDGDRIDRCEMYDEADVEVALARFDELNQQAPRLQNAATQLWARLTDAFNRRDLEDYLAVGNSELRYEDRRRGLRDEFEGPAEQRQAVLALFGAAQRSIMMTAEPIAVRGSRLALMHVCYRDTDYAERPITVEMIQIAEVDTDGLLAYSVSFDPENIDAAFDELDARYVVGEAATNADTWSVITRTYAAYNRNELPRGDWINVDHRKGTPFTTTDDLTAVIRTWRDVTPDFCMHIEEVHKLNAHGAVITHTSSGSSPEGFNAEWRMVQLLTVAGDRIDRCEMFDETDIDDAVARFDELSREARRG